MAEISTMQAPSATHVSGSAGRFVNYDPPTQERKAVLIAETLERYPGAVIVNGSDDWYAPNTSRPELLVRQAGIQPLAWFHVGVSGISKSGAVLAGPDMVRFLATLVARREHLRLRPDDWARKNRHRVWALTFHTACGTVQA